MQNIQLSVTGMMCEACAGHVTKAVQSVAGVRSVQVDLAGEKAAISGDSLDVSQLIAAVEAEGYQASEIA